MGGVGRPDLVGALSPDATPEILSEHMFKSLHEKLMALDDDVEVLPAHGERLRREENGNFLFSESNEKRNSREISSFFFLGLTRPRDFFCFRSWFTLREGHRQGAVLDDWSRTANKPCTAD